MPLLEISELCISYGDMQAVHRASLKVEEQDVVVIVGSNGAGKSTILKAISGLLPRPISPEIE